MSHVRDRIGELFRRLQAHGVESGELDDLVVECKCAEAASINNGGLQEQLCYLLDTFRDDGLEVCLRFGITDRKQPEKASPDLGVIDAAQREAAGFLNRYRCPACDVSWEDTWSCMCNDRCPRCRAEIEPYMSTPLHAEVPEKEP